MANLMLHVLFLIALLEIPLDLFVAPRMKIYPGDVIDARDALLVFFSSGLTSGAECEGVEPVPIAKGTSVKGPCSWN
jgi:hypothetical protein